MKYRLENLNQVQYADDEARRKKLEAKGFHVVSVEADKKQETGTPGSTDIPESFVETGLAAEKTEETVKAVEKVSKRSKKPAAGKKMAAKENPEDAGTDREPEAAGGEGKDAG